MSLPAYRVDIAFTTLPDDPAPTWVDVTGYVLFASGINIQRGRGDEFEEIGPSSLSLSLNNKDGRFSPDNPDGAYSPNVKKGRLIRVLAAGVPRFTGYVASWGTTWPGGNSASSFVDVRAMSRMAGMSRGSELRDIISSEYDLDSPVAHYTMGEPAGSGQAYDSSGNNTARLFQGGSGTAVVFGTATGPGTDGLTGATFAGGKYLRVNAGEFAQGASDFIMMEAFVNTAATATDSVVVGLIDNLGFFYGITINAAGKAVAQDVGGGALTSTTTVMDGATHHVAWAYSSGTNLTTLYVDGVSEGTPATPSAGNPAFTTQFMVGGSTSSTALTGSVAHAAIFSNTTAAISAARIADHGAAGLTGFTDDTSGERIERLATYVGIPSPYVLAEPGSATSLTHRDTTGRTPLDLMLEVTATEGGTLFDAKDGTLTFQGRDHRYGAAVVATFAPATDLAPVLDDFGMTNEVTATGDDGVSAVVKDQGSIDEHGHYRVSLELMSTSEDDVYQAAAWRLGTGMTPVTRIPTATANLHGLTTTARNAVLAIEIGDRVRLTNLPDQAPASTMDFFVEGYTEAIDPLTHVWTANLSPAWVYDVWVLNDTTYSVLGTTTRLGL